jgi:hypothetical protein
VPDRLIKFLRDAYAVALQHLQQDLIGIVSPLVYEGVDLLKGIGVVHPESSIPGEVEGVGGRGLGQGNRKNQF